jgi:hypothetical protein
MYNFSCDGTSFINFRLGYADRYGTLAGVFADAQHDRCGNGLLQEDGW